MANTEVVTWTTVIVRSTIRYRDPPTVRTTNLTHCPSPSLSSSIQLSRLTLQTIDDPKSPSDRLGIDFWCIPHSVCTSVLPLWTTAYSPSVYWTEENIENTTVVWVCTAGDLQTVRACHRKSLTLSQRSIQGADVLWWVETSMISIRNPVKHAEVLISGVYLCPEESDSE